MAVHVEANYVLGHSDGELERLRRQANLIDPITRQFMLEAGIAEGMHVLDVGSGAGDVSLLVEKIVGPQGHVVGVDRSSVAVAKACARAEQLALKNVSFYQSDLETLQLDRRFDAIVGRYVLCFQPDPAATIRLIAKLARPGGIVLFHEPDRTQMRSHPPVPSYDRACRWVNEAYRRTGVDTLVGLKLYSAFLAAGLPGPTMRLHAVIGGATDIDVIHLDADQAVILAPEIIRMGIATSEELGLETLVQRIVEEMVANHSVIVGRGEIGAWSAV